MYAAKGGHTDLVKMLHEFGADVNHQNAVSCYVSIVYSLSNVRVISEKK